MERYGREAKKGDGSRRFTGTHRVGQISATTGLGLRIRGYDPEADSFGAEDGIAVEMFDPRSETVAASWSLERLANCWNAKHASAMYIPAEAQDAGDGKAKYRYGNEVLVGEGTDVFRLLRAIYRGLVWYDPADSIYANGKPKVRSQWRTQSRHLETTMRTLYGSSRLLRIN
jgi:hypothetical protein